MLESRRCVRIGRMFLVENMRYVLSRMVVEPYFVGCFSRAAESERDETQLEDYNVVGT